MKRKNQFFFLLLIVLLINSSCSFYDRYKPSDEWYSTNIKSFEIHFQFGSSYAWMRREAIKQSSIDRIRKKGYKIISISESNQPVFENISGLYKNTADALMLISSVVGVQEPENSTKPSALWPINNMFNTYHIYTFSPKRKMLFYGPPPPWYDHYRKGSGDYRDKVFAETEDDFINRVANLTFQNLPVTY